jgi:ribosomal protein S14
MATSRPCARRNRRTAIIRDIELSRDVQRALGTMKTRLPDVEHWKA